MAMVVKSLSSTPPWAAIYYGCTPAHAAAGVIKADFWGLITRGLWGINRG